MSTLVVDDLSFEIRRSGRRRTVEITIERDGELIVSAPSNCAEARLQDFVQRKRAWIYQQLARREELVRVVPRKEFIDGEGFNYLGRSYRLRLVETPAPVDAPVRLIGGRFLMPRALASDGRSHLIRWYAEHARPWLQGKVAEWADRMEVRPAGVRVQELGFRWGSCGKGDLLYFHWKTILLPARIVEYVVVHEMAHLHEPHHTPAFWRRVERAMPDFALRRQWLDTHGFEVEGL